MKHAPYIRMIFFTVALLSSQFAGAWPGGGCKLF